MNAFIYSKNAFIVYGILSKMEEKILNFVKENGSITRTHAADLCGINDLQVKRLLQKLAAKYEKFQLVGERRGAHYIWNA